MLYNYSRQAASHYIAKILKSHHVADILGGCGTLEKGVEHMDYQRQSPVGVSRGILHQKNGTTKVLRMDIPAF